MHSQFGRTVFKKDLNGVCPYRDPAEPIASQHIKRAAENASFTADEIDETFRLLSEHMGWDITKGAT